MSSESDNVLSITLRGREIPIMRKMLPQVDLRFYLQNPRVYSIVRQDGDRPDQEDILDALRRMDHVKQLVQAIRQNGGLTDPLFVRDADKVVIEGNSRLAAYRILATNNPVVWGLVKCDVIMADINDDDVRTLLTHYHIVGRKRWDPYEQAGLFWRWSQENISLDEISKRVEEMGISSRKIRHWIEVYSLMVDSHDASPDRWSYWDDFVKNRDIRRARKEHPEFTQVFVQKMKSGEIEKAVEVRTKVAKIAKVGGKTLKTFITKKQSLDDCFDRAVARGATDVLYNKLRKFREVIADPDAKRDIKAMPDSLRNKCAFELNRIKNAVERLLEAIE